MAISKLARLLGPSDCIELDFVEGEATPKPLMRLSGHLHGAELSFFYTVRYPDSFGVQRARSIVNNRVQKADLSPEDGKNTNHVEVDETVIQLNDQQFWLYATIDPKTNEFLHVWLLLTRTIVLIEQFPKELEEKYDVADAVFLVDGAPRLQAPLFEENLRFQHITHGNRNAIECIF